MKKFVFVFGLLGLWFSRSEPARANNQPPVMPFVVWGKLNPNGHPIDPAADQLRAQIGHLTVAPPTSLVTTPDNGLYYKLKIPADNPATPTKDGGVPGDLISFWVGKLQALETTSWEAETSTHLDLTLPPAPTLTPTPTATSAPTPTPATCQAPNRCSWWWGCPKNPQLNCSRWQRCCPGRPIPPPTPTPTPNPRPTPIPPPSQTNQPPTVNSSTLPDGRFLQTYQATIAAADEDGDQIKLTAANLPKGLSLLKSRCRQQGGLGRQSKTTCFLAGRPYQLGSFQVKITATDSRGASSQKILPLTIRLR